MKYLILYFCFFYLACTTQPKQNNSRNPAQLAGLSGMEKLKTVMENIDGNLSNLCHGEECDMLRWLKELSEKYSHCKGFFVDKDDKLGVLAKSVFKDVGTDIINNANKSVFMREYQDLNTAEFIDKESGKNLKPLCPGYHKMDELQRAIFWSYLFEVTAFFEVTCDPEKKAKGVNTLAVGLYQLEWPLSKRSWRGGACAKPDQEILTPEGNTSCAVHIFKWSLNKDNSVMSSLVNGKVRPFKYWHAHNFPHNAKEQASSESVHNRFKRYLSRFKYCQESS